MASLHRMAFAELTSSGAGGTPLKVVGSVYGCELLNPQFPNFVAKNSCALRFKWRSRCSSRSSSSTRIPLSVRCYVRGGWSKKLQPPLVNLNSSTFPENFVVRTNVSRRNLLFQLGDDGGYEEGPIELPPRELDIDPLAFPEANPLQIAASFLLTGTIAVLLFRSLRRRAQRAKDRKFRSSGVETSKSIKEDARRSAVAKLTQAPEVPVAPPSPVQTFLGAVVAGAIALVLYQVTTSVEGSFVGKPVSMNYTIRNMTITVRTIINGILYLATFVFGANSIGLGLYSIQLLFGDSPPEPPRVESPENEQKPSSETEVKSEGKDKN
ncbi:hypothetical protein R1sor_023829 [Riccia sorocarpa]|uniref:Transmembrane protein n=1 Tax=Riccia sorocarpa TaxID=122646 RepID=A0ABD3GPJ4_9MARC